MSREAFVPMDDMVRLKRKEAFEAWVKECIHNQAMPRDIQAAFNAGWQASRKAALLEEADKFANRDGFLACAMQLRRMAEGE